MAFALISDIHGDAKAFDAVLADLARLGIDDAVVLGDVAQGGDDPAAVLDRLAELRWPVILGNGSGWKSPTGMTSALTSTPRSGTRTATALPDTR